MGEQSCRSATTSISTSPMGSQGSQESSLSKRSVFNILLRPFSKPLSPSDGPQHDNDSSNNNTCNLQQQRQRQQQDKTMTGILRTPYSSSIIRFPMLCHIRSIDGELMREIPLHKHHSGQYLMNRLKEALELVDTKCFGLKLAACLDDQEDLVKSRWLDLTTSVYKQVKELGKTLEIWHEDPTTGSRHLVFYFRIKFYPPNADRINDHFTQNYLWLQLRRDLRVGKLTSSYNNMAQLAAAVLQFEYGDYNKASTTTAATTTTNTTTTKANNSIRLRNYYSKLDIMPNQKSIESLIVQIHQNEMAGLSPEQAQLHFLRVAVTFETYGFDFYMVRDHQRQRGMMLGFNYAGIKTIRNGRVLHHFPWHSIRKITYERRMVILHTSSDSKKQIVGYKCPTLADCRNLHKRLMEQRYFFTVDLVAFDASMRGSCIRGQSEASVRYNHQHGNGNNKATGGDPRRPSASMSNNFYHSPYSCYSLSDDYGMMSTSRSAVACDRLSGSETVGDRLNLSGQEAPTERPRSTHSAYQQQQQTSKSYRPATIPSTMLEQNFGQAKKRSDRGFQAKLQRQHSVFFADSRTTSLASSSSTYQVNKDKENDNENNKDKQNESDNIEYIRNINITEDLINDCGFGGSGSSPYGDNANDCSADYYQDLHQRPSSSASASYSALGRAHMTGEEGLDSISRRGPESISPTSDRDHSSPTVSRTLSFSQISQLSSDIEDPALVNCFMSDSSSSSSMNSSFVKTVASKYPDKKRPPPPPPQSSSSASVAHHQSPSSTSTSTSQQQQSSPPSSRPATTKAAKRRAAQIDRERAKYDERLKNDNEEERRSKARAKLVEESRERLLRVLLAVGYSQPRANEMSQLVTSVYFTRYCWLEDRLDQFLLNLPGHLSRMASLNFWVPTFLRRYICDHGRSSRIVANMAKLSIVLLIFQLFNQSSQPVFRYLLDFMGMS